MTKFWDHIHLKPDGLAEEVTMYFHCVSTSILTHRPLGHVFE